MRFRYCTYCSHYYCTVYCTQWVFTRQSVMAFFHFCTVIVVVKSAYSSITAMRNVRYVWYLTLLEHFTMDIVCIKHHPTLYIDRLQYIKERSTLHQCRAIVWKRLDGMDDPFSICFITLDWFADHYSITAVVLDLFYFIDCHYKSHKSTLMMKLQLKLHSPAGTEPMIIDWPLIITVRRAIAFHSFYLFFNHSTIMLLVTILSPSLSLPYAFILSWDTCWR